VSAPNNRVAGVERAAGCGRADGDLPCIGRQRRREPCRYARAPVPDGLEDAPARA
jgi:hypothetical protein